MPRRREERRAVERLVLDEPGRPGVGQDPGVGQLVAGRVGIRHDDHRQAERRHLGQGRGAGPADDEIGRPEGLGHVVAQERHGPVALAQPGRQRLARRSAAA